MLGAHSDTSLQLLIASSEINRKRLPRLEKAKAVFWDHRHIFVMQQAKPSDLLSYAKYNNPVRLRLLHSRLSWHSGGTPHAAWRMPDDWNPGFKWHHHPYHSAAASE